MMRCLGVGSTGGSRFFFASKLSLRDLMEDSFIILLLSNEVFPAVNLVVGMIKKKKDKDVFCNWNSPPFTHFIIIYYFFALPACLSCPQRTEDENGNKKSLFFFFCLFILFQSIIMADQVEEDGFVKVERFKYKPVTNKKKNKKKNAYTFKDSDDWTIDDVTTTLKDRK